MDSSGIAVPSSGIASGGFGDERDNQSSARIEKYYTRHTPEQTARLEEIFSENTLPDHGQRLIIAQELGLEKKQVKFWFQNKRTQKKVQKERADNIVLRVENEKLENENIVMRESLKNILCPSCGGPSRDNSKDREHSRQQLQLENKRLKDEYKKVCELLQSYEPSYQPGLQLNLNIEGSSHDPSLAVAGASNSAAENLCLDLTLASASYSIPDKNKMPKPLTQTEEMKKASIMLMAATAAKDELVTLLRFNEPLWMKSSADQRRLILHRECYMDIFPRVNHLKSSKAREESSKDSRIVRMNPMKLIGMLLDSHKWSNLFSTIITRAHTIKVLEKGSLENRSGALQLMYGEMHVLSPYVPCRQFYFLRYCDKVEDGVWVMVDVSFDWLKEKNPPYRSWRLPSGCMITAMPNGSSQVTWVEHVEVEDNIETHSLYKDVVSSGIAYGAERWLIELNRICERFYTTSTNNIPSYDTWGVNISLEGRRKMTKLSHRMIKSFCETMNMSVKIDVPQSSTDENNSGIRLCVRNSTDPKQPNGKIFVAATSFWIPNSWQNLFQFFIDVEKRVKWDFLASGHPVTEIAQISTGTHPGSKLSIIRPLNPTGTLVIEESFSNPLGSYVIYAPIKELEYDMLISGAQDVSNVFLLPSGVTISEDGRSNENARASSSSSIRTRGSLVTIAFQIVNSSQAEVNFESMRAVNKLITSTVKNIKEALNSCDLE